MADQDLVPKAEQDPIPIEELEASRKRYRALKTILALRGIADVPEETREGKLIATLTGELQRAGNPRLPEFIRAVLAEQAVCGILLYRAAFTHVMFANEILQNLLDEHDDPLILEDQVARRTGAQQEYNRAVAALGKANDIVLKNFSALGVESEGESGKGVLEEILGRLRREIP